MQWGKGQDVTQMQWGAVVGRAQSIVVDLGAAAADACVRIAVIIQGDGVRAADAADLAGRRPRHVEQSAAVAAEKRLGAHGARWRCVCGQEI